MGLLDDRGRWSGRVFTGEWTRTGAAAASTEPSTGDELGEVGTATAGDLARSAARAAERGQDWAHADYRERARVLRRAAALFEQHRDEIACWLTREAGKTATAVELELDLALDELHEAASLASAPWGTLLPTTQEGRTSIARRVPFGVVAVIAPWNFPLVLALRSVAPALATGNAVLLKPASDTAICCGVVIARLFEEAGLPSGVLHMLPGKGSELGTAVADDPHIDMISFTGSTPVGRELAKAAAGGFKKFVSELGGNNAFVVLDDADIPAAAAAGAFGSFVHQGQVCMAVGRHLVAEEIADAYVEELTRLADGLRVGDPREDVDLGPVITSGQADHIDDVVRRSVDAGAKVTAGGDRDGLFVRPTVLAGVSPDAAAFTEEVFGPVAAVTTFADDDEAVRLANATPYGLVAGVHSGSSARARAVGDRLHAGMIHVNDQTVNDETLAPFGGIGDSGGSSRFGAFVNLEEFTRWQWVTVRDEQSHPCL
ncbi:aldehyde dehydrogenase family protein [Amycolatopsis echigonensis]|uniref:Aldehyde dehydrogenase family protein n=1 Tax=Amycolatopsis echigonensis TaxID=2576905 RepID=A0A2N3WUI8_9PSEU|nr:MULTISPECIES: aldehyde dehydrogenase family protein [Amycolatopsis]MBB2497766.1 aldehyde dehydrogenase family protein [Amycolatopsis echigonensis]PKV97532.1 benzaldehyde dehydrogenase (NAD) [Amycolatopsis niigatensis]